MNLSKTFAAIQYASHKLLALNDEKINQILLAAADVTEKRIDFILAENWRGLNRVDTSNPKYDRLILAPERLEGIATDIHKVVKLSLPVGRVQKQGVMPSGLKIKRVNVPFGVISVIYEVRPSVSFDVLSLCLKSGNVYILKDGGDADCSNRAIIGVVCDMLKQFETDLHIMELFPSDHEATTELLHTNDYVDLAVPRGDSNLINFVHRNAIIPVIETGTDICHTFFDRYRDVGMGVAVIDNAKTRHVSACNTLDYLLAGIDRMKDPPALYVPLQESNVIIYTDTLTYASLQGRYPAQLLKEAMKEDLGTEFLNYKMAVEAVEGVDSAITYIQQYDSRHSECTATEDEGHTDWFYREVGVACAYVNASTSFTDDVRFELDAEIGISTQKLHACGSMALEETTTYKWIIEGEG